MGGKLLVFSNIVGRYRAREIREAVRSCCPKPQRRTVYRVKNENDLRQRRSREALSNREFPQLCRETLTSWIDNRGLSPYALLTLMQNAPGIYERSSQFAVAAAKRWTSNCDVLAEFLCVWPITGY
jgi:hypothetical protein